MTKIFVTKTAKASVVSIHFVRFDLYKSCRCMQWSHHIEWKKNHFSCEKLY